MGDDFVLVCIKHNRRLVDLHADGITNEGAKIYSCSNPPPEPQRTIPAPVIPFEAHVPGVRGHYLLKRGNNRPG